MFQCTVAAAAFVAAAEAAHRMVVKSEEVRASSTACFEGGAGERGLRPMPRDLEAVGAAATGAGATLAVWPAHRAPPPSTRAPARSARPEVMPAV